MTRDEAEELLLDWFECRMDAREAQFKQDRERARAEANAIKDRLLDAMTNGVLQQGKGDGNG